VSTLFFFFIFPRLPCCPLYFRLVCPCPLAVCNCHKWTRGSKPKAKYQTTYPHNCTTRSSTLANHTCRVGLFLTALYSPYLVLYLLITPDPLRLLSCVFRRVFVVSDNTTNQPPLVVITFFQSTNIFFFRPNSLSIPQYRQDGFGGFEIARPTMG
jgi:hypothetical protein